MLVNHEFFIFVNFLYTLLIAFCLKHILIICWIFPRSFKFYFFILEKLLVMIRLKIIKILFRLFKTSKMLRILFKRSKLILCELLLWKTTYLKVGTIIINVNILCYILHNIIMSWTRILEILIIMLTMRLSIACLLHVKHILSV